MRLCSVPQETDNTEGKSCLSLLKDKYKKACVLQHLRLRAFSLTTGNKPNTTTCFTHIVIILSFEVKKQYQVWYQ